MVRIRILTGARAGEDCRLGRFPGVIGRSTDADLTLGEPGVWDRHLELRLGSSRQFSMDAVADALLVVNGKACREAHLRNGDVIEIGSARLQFWLAETAQRALHFREGMIWGGIAVISAAQGGLIYWLLH